MVRRQKQNPGSKEKKMSKVITIFVTVVVMAAAIYGVYQWALDGNGPTGKELIREQIMNFIDETEVQGNAARRKVEEFGSMVLELKRRSVRTIRYLQMLVQKEARAQQSVSVIESELRFMKGRIKKGEPIRHADGSALSPEEVELRSIARGEELAGARECLQVITQEKQYFEKLHNRQVKNLRLAPIHRQILRTRLATLDQKLRMYRQRRERLDSVGAGADAYSTLFSEAKQAIAKAEDSLTGAFGTAETGFKPLLRECSDEKISSSGAAADRALARIDALLAGK